MSVTGARLRVSVKAVGGVEKSLHEVEMANCEVHRTKNDEYNKSRRTSAYDKYRACLE